MTITATSLTGPVLVTVAYLVLWYCLLVGLQRRTKYRLQAEYLAEGKEFDRYFGQDEQMLAADRAVGNTHEQMVPFLVTLWLTALFVSTTFATVAGSLYVLLRAGYPLLLGKRVSRMQPKRVYLVTVPCYLIIFSMLVSLVWQALT